jgi:hypothetical protein
MSSFIQKQLAGGMRIGLQQTCGSTGVVEDWPPVAAFEALVGLNCIFDKGESGGRLEKTS